MVLFIKNLQSLQSNKHLIVFDILKRFSVSKLEKSW